MNNQSSSMINKLSVSQNLEMASQHNSTAEFSSRYKFNAKELDQETGWYYYGARYYDPSVSQWMSVDPLVEDFASQSPYVYTANNPVYYIDKDGMAPGGPGDELVEKGRKAINKIGNSVMSFIITMTGANISMRPPNPKPIEKMDSNDKIDVTSNLVVSVKDNSKDAMIGLAYTAGDVLDKGGSDIAGKSALTTLSTGGLSSEVTVPLSATAGTVSMIGKGTKGLILFGTDNNKAAAKEASHLLVDGIATVAGAKGSDQLLKANVVTKGDINLLSATYDYMVSIFTSDKKE